MGELKKVLAGEADVPGTGVVEVVEGHPEARRNETAFEKLDRNWGDLLQELRVMQTGTQIVTAFLIILPFISRSERPRPLPNSITEAVLAKHGGTSPAQTALAH